MVAVTAARPRFSRVRTSTQRKSRWETKYFQVPLARRRGKAQRRPRRVAPRCRCLVLPAPPPPSKSRRRTALVRVEPVRKSWNLSISSAVQEVRLRSDQATRGAGTLPFGVSVQKAHLAAYQPVRFESHFQRCEILFFSRFCSLVNNGRTAEGTLLDRQGSSL